MTIDPFQGDDLAKTSLGLVYCLMYQRREEGYESGTRTSNPCDPLAFLLVKLEASFRVNLEPKPHEHAEPCFSAYKKAEQK